MAPDGSSLTRVTNDGGGDIVLGWSPDCTHLLYQRSVEQSDAEWDLWVVNADGSNARQLTDWPGEEGHAVFSPDGQYIAFTSDHLDGPGAWDVYILSLTDHAVAHVASFDHSSVWVSDWVFEPS